MHTKWKKIISKNIKEKNINEIISSLGNNTDLRSNTFILISNNSAEETLKTISNTNETFTPKIYQKIIILERFGFLTGEPKTKIQLSKMHGVSKQCITLLY